MANVFGLPYRIFVFIAGIVITMLSVTGVYIWWKKRGFRRHIAAQIRHHRTEQSAGALASR
jgi:uncharacterized iron-regulated membrane protein